MSISLGKDWKAQTVLCKGAIDVAGLYVEQREMFGDDNDSAVGCSVW